MASSESQSLRRFHLDGVHDTGKVIGRGAFAVVHELEFRGLRCAGKTLHVLLYDSIYASCSKEAYEDLLLHRFAAECELLAKLFHPNIVQFLGVRMEEGSKLPDLVMEYLPITLDQCIGLYGKTLPNNISCSILLDVAVGLHYLHEFSPPIIHRDLSSNNILLTMSMTAKISDLGMAKILDVSNAQASIYMPPEIKTEEPKYNSKVDVFSYGVIMVHVLSGEYPIPSDLLAVSLCNSSSEFERRSKSIKKITKGHFLLGLIRLCLSDIPDNRPEAAVVVYRLRAERAQVSDTSKSKLELLQQIQKYSREIESLKDENQSLRKENKSLQADVILKDYEIDTLYQIMPFDQNKQPSYVKAQQIKFQEVMESAQMEFSQEQLQAEIDSLKSQVRGMRSRLRSMPSKINRVQYHPGRTRLEWRRGADAPEKFSQAQAVVIGENVYVGSGTAKMKIIQYSWTREAWISLPNCPVIWFGLTQFKGKLTTVGGVDQRGLKTGLIFQFIAESHQWRESLPPMPTARSRVTVISNRSSSSMSMAFVVIGGQNNRRKVCNTVEVFSQHNYQWYTAEPIPTPLYLLTAATVGDITYILGGVDSDHSGTKHCFSVCLDSLINNATSSKVSLSQDSPLWIPISDTPLTDSCAASLGGSLVAIGGKDSSTSPPSAAIYLLTISGSWERMEGGNIPEPHYWSTAVCLPSNELVVVGGQCPGIQAKSSLFVALVTHQ